MARLWINNLPPSFGEEDIAALLEKYGLPRFDRITMVPGDGTRLAAALTYGGVDEELLRRLQPRIHGLYVQEHALHVQVAPPARPEP